MPPVDPQRRKPVQERGPPSLAFAAAEAHDYGLVTMGQEFKTIGAGEFKARCLALLDEVAERGEVIVVTKRGVPVARVVPVEYREGSDLAGSIVREGDLITPLDDPWEAER